MVVRVEQEQALAGILQGVNEGYLSPTVSVCGPPGTGKTFTVRRIPRRRRTGPGGDAGVDELHRSHARRDLFDRTSEEFTRCDDQPLSFVDHMSGVLAEEHDIENVFTFDIDGFHTLGFIVDPFGPRSCYDESKRYGESIVRAYRDQHDIDVRVARIFNTYGPRMRLDDGRVIPTFIGQALAGEDRTVHGEGKQTRCFCYVSDMIDGLLALMDSGVEMPVNVGNPDERTILELAELVIELTGSESGIAHEPRPPRDPSVRRPDLSKARRELGWKPEVSLRSGLEEIIADLR